jgi:hypothetical protein
MHSSGRDRSHRDGCGSTPRPKLIRAVTLVTEYECNRAFLISIKSFNILVFGIVLGLVRWSRFLFRCLVGP